MPTIGWFEILIVVAISIVVIGPKDFPHMLKKVGSWIGSTKKYISNFQNEIADINIDTDVTEKDKDKKDKDKNDKI
jgi:sec-independent protein translocase protein TatB